jgi:hypothetical protein
VPGTPVEGEPDPEGPQLGESREWPDSRKVGGDYLLSREQVDKWVKTIIEEVLCVGSVHIPPISNL